MEMDDISEVKDKETDTPKVGNKVGVAFILMFPSIQIFFIDLFFLFG